MLVDDRHIGWSQLMPKCLNCNASVDSGETTCSKCGTPLTDASSSDNPEVAAQNDTIHQLLLNANLLKIRGDLDGAVAECINALRIDPDNITAHSLIGDIYRGQGKAEEALRWYRLALDISPNSMRDRARVDELTKEELEKVGPAASTDWKFSSLTLWTLLAVFIALTVVTLGIHMRRAPHRDLADRRPSAAATIDQSPSTEDAQSSAQPKGEATAPAPVKPVFPTEHTDREATVIGKMNASSILMNGNIRVSGMVIDPRDNSATITFTSHGTNGLPSSQVLVHNSLLVAREVFQVDSLLSRAVLRAEYPLSDNGELHPQIAFVGEVKREALENFNVDGSHYGEQVGIFDNPWWAPNVESK
jgi:hypothetical protein